MYIYEISRQPPLKLWTYTLKDELQGSKMSYLGIGNRERGKA
jgi:hypothetical protein